MEILYLLIPLSLVLVFVIGVVLWWSVKNGQFDDLQGPAYRVLMDDDEPNKSKPLSDAQALEKGPTAQSKNEIQN